MEFNHEIRSKVYFLWSGPDGECAYRAVAWLGLDKCPIMERLIIVSPSGEQTHNQPWDTTAMEALYAREG